MPRGPKHHHSDRDRIFTPRPLALRLIGKIPARSGDSWCDPCRGSGAFFEQFPTENREWFEIDDGRDFLAAAGQWDWVVTNIPFSRPAEFIRAMARAARKGFGILCLANSMTATRLRMLEGMWFYPHSVTVLYVREWGFGYRTDFYVFTKSAQPNIETAIS